MYAQVGDKNILKKEFSVKHDTIRIDSVSISPYYFKVYNADDRLIGPELYSVDFARAELILDPSVKNFNKKIYVEYQPLPEFLTRQYKVLDRDLITEKTSDLTALYNPNKVKRNKNIKLFDGLYTSGNLSRGITVGNNQDAVVNSDFNLQIQGNLSENIGIRASITDNNVPLQEGGYTQRIDEFDRVFIELFSKNWKINAGDVYLQNNQNYFLRFNKKVAGVYVTADIEHGLGKTNVFASGALVRGKFSSYKFTGTEGNQGPYKLIGQNNEQYFLIVSGSETVYANGIPLKRGENLDYVMDYNTGEITFTTLYPVNANMRFTVDFQIVENNYNRFITYDGADLKNDKLEIGVKYYNETDLKNSQLQQELTEEQKQILAEAGDDETKMVSISAVPQEYSENKILYKKEIQNSTEIFIYSTDPSDELYEVRYSYVGENKGDYIIETTLAPGRVYRYAEPVNSVKQGSYAPVIQLIAPQKLQIADIDLNYNYSEKGNIRSELAFSNSDKNMFSNIDNDNNNGFAGKINWKQNISDRRWKLDANADLEYISSDFTTVERYRNVEFSRDWNLSNPELLKNTGQGFFSGGLVFRNDKSGRINYQFESLNFQENFKGNRHNLYSDLTFGQTKIFIKSSILNSESVTETHSFDRWYSMVKHNFSKAWIGGKLNYEKNKSFVKDTELLNNISHKLSETEIFGGIGDSAKVFMEAGYNYQKVDSVQQNTLQKVNHAHTFFIHSKLIQSKNTDLAVNGNYRKISNVNFEDEESLNARLFFRQNFFKGLLNYNLIYETQSGSLPQQDFSYVEVEPGKGFYTWIDFNNNNIQELNEFVIAKFQDEATYVRVLLPNVNFIRTHRNKFSQSLNINMIRWQNDEGLKKALSHFSDQAYFLIDANEKRGTGARNFNPFVFDEDNLLALNMQIKNSLFFNRGLQKFSTGYIYLNSRKKSYLSTGDQDNQIKSHQFQFSHKIGSFWLIDINGVMSEIQSRSNTYSNRNYLVDQKEILPKLSFLYSKNTRMELYYSYKNKENQISEFETLKMSTLGSSFQYSNRNRFSVNASFNWIDNQFEGNKNSPVAYQMLEGLQPGKNMTWVLGVQKRLMSFLDVNINYFGRSSERSKTIHTGTIQLRASF
jgi:hypothetical protein